MLLLWLNHNREWLLRLEGALGDHCFFHNRRSLDDHVQIGRVENVLEFLRLDDYRRHFCLFRV